MEIISENENIELNCPTAVTIGKFDGVHLGHQKLFRVLRREAEGKLKTVVFTFDRPTNGTLGTDEVLPLMSREEKREKIASLGIDYLIEYPFTDKVRHMSAADFVREILVEKLEAKVLVVGPDCGFGYRRSGNVELLQQMSEECGYRLIVVKKAKDPISKRTISSSLIRELLTNGETEEAARLLG